MRGKACSNIKADLHFRTCIRALAFIALTAEAPVGVLSAQAVDAAERFESRIRPLLIAKCQSCHGDAAVSGLRTDSRDSLLRGGSRGPALVPGDPDASLLYQAVSETHATLRMPATGPLPEDDVKALREWIADGAVWPESRAEFFLNRVQPIFTESCVGCHGAAPLGGLGLDSAAALARGGASGPAVKPGNPSASLLLQRLRHADEKLQMPPGKPLSGDQVAILEQWVRDGAVWPTGSEIEGFSIGAEQRAHWAFQPVSKPPVPDIAGAAGPIDAFLLARLRTEGLSPSAPADKRTLLRRVTYDLTGLPPAPPEIEAFLADDSPDAFARVVDRLLESPRYGEKWGRHWMDVIRYSDTAGDSADYPVPQMRHYRDYIIESFNRDKPYDQFVREQIAGDLLPAANEQQRWEQIVATGYLAGARRFDVLPERNMHLTFEDAIDNLGKAFLGLSVSCARCHDHKFDPISQQDYYRLYGILDSTAFPYAGSERRHGQWGLTPRDPEEWAKWSEPIQAEWDKVDQELRELVAQTDAYFRDVAASKDKTNAERNNTDYTRVRDLFNKDRTALLAKLPPPPTAAFAIWEGEPRDGYVHLRGEPDQRGEPVKRGFLEILGGQTLSDPNQSGRAELAGWIADPANPLTARVMVNRVWQYHFGRGIVASPNDFGFRGEAPTHLELLDYLAARFVEQGWSVKALHREILLSNAYRQSSAPNPAAMEKDPENKLLWRFTRRRLSAEELRDSLLAISLRLEYGPAEVHPFKPQSEWAYSQHRPFHDVYDSNRRGVYLMTQRIQKHPYLGLFDGADTNATTAVRKLTTNPIQSLYLINSDQVHSVSTSFAQRLLDAGDTLDAQIDLAHRLAVGRPADRAEIENAAAFMASAQTALGRAEVPESQHRRDALASYARALFAANDFLFID